MPLPLSGLLVVALEQAVAAPLCTCRLADAGARVLKIERPEGDFARYYDKLAHGESAYFVWLNRGKESVILDLTQADDKALLAAMLARADVFVQNLKPGAIEGCARPMRLGGLPASVCMSGTAIQSAIASNREIETAAPSPLRSRAISASRIAS